ncbi:MAG: DNA-protecting protein DprA [Clostridia bacterium]|nr:DNA-protecting protein DprA [Clostridia bacterium]
MKKYNENELAVICLDYYDQLEYKHKAHLLSLCANPSEIFSDENNCISYLTDNLGEGVARIIKQALFDRDNLKNYQNHVLKQLRDRKIVAITCFSDNYPEQLKHVPSAPLVLYAKGNTDLLFNKHRVAIVGSRKTQNFVLKVTEEIAYDLSSAGCAVISGSAVGGDRSALLGSERNNRAISILAHGHDYVYPQANRTLIDKVAQSGLVISEYPPHTPSAAWRFPMRNRLIAALCTCAVIVSGEVDSGTKYTAKFAEAYSKPIYAFPYSMGERSGEICNLLIKMNKAQLVENSSDIATFEGIKIDNKQAIDITEEERSILVAMNGQTHIDQIAERTGKKAHEIMYILSMLEIKGLVAKESGNIYTSLVKI